MIDRINKLIELGFSQIEIDRMANIFKNTFKLRPERLETAFRNLVDCGFPPRLAKECFVHTPSIFGKSIKTTKGQIDLYKEIFGDEFVGIIAKNPRRFIQGYSVTYDRYNILKSLGLTNEDYEDIFLPKLSFNKKYSS